MTEERSVADALQHFVDYARSMNEQLCLVHACVKQLIVDMAEMKRLLKEREGHGHTKEEDGSKETSTEEDQEEDRPKAPPRIGHSKPSSDWFHTTHFGPDGKPLEDSHGRFEQGSVTERRSGPDASGTK